MLTFVLNAGFVAVTTEIVNGFEVPSRWPAFLIALWLAMRNVGFGGLVLPAFR